MVSSLNKRKDLCDTKAIKNVKICMRVPFEEKTLMLMRIFNRSLKSARIVNICISKYLNNKLMQIAAVFEILY